MIIGIDKATGKDFTKVWFPPKEYLERKDKEVIHGSDISASKVRRETRRAKMP